MHSQRLDGGLSPSFEWTHRTGVLSAVVIGGAAGLGEVALAGYRRMVLGRLAFVPEYFWWSAPWISAAAMLVITLAAMTCWPSRWHHLRHLPRVALPTAIALWATLRLLLPGLHTTAAFILAAGVGVAVAPVLDEWARRFRRTVVMAGALMLGIVPIGATWFFRLPALRPAARDAAGAAPASLPNILLLILDTVRAEDLSLYGAPVSTSPVLERLGAAGVTFERASSTAPWTLPSHASIFTGRWAHELSTTLLTPLDGAHRTLAEVLADHGYATAGFSANLEYATAETGLARGFQHFEDHRPTLAGLAMMTRVSRLLARPIHAAGAGGTDMPGRIGADEMNARLLRWLRRERPDRYFAFMNYYDAHAPYFPTEPYWTTFVGSTPRRPIDNVDAMAADPDAVALARLAYQGAIRRIDDAISALLDSLQTLAAPAPTLIVITSDHGEEFAEHGLMGHGNTLYYPSVHVPLVLVWPGHLPAGCRIAAPVSNRSIPATVADLLGLDASFPGGTLAATWRDAAEPALPVLTHTQRGINQPAHYPASRGPIFGAQQGALRLLVESDPPAAVAFDHDRDPGELIDILADGSRATTIGHLLAVLADAGAPVAGIEGGVGAAIAPDFSAEQVSARSGCPPPATLD